MTKFKRHTNTLQRDGNDIISYRTKVATIIGDQLHVHGKYTSTTTRHINYVADELNLTKVNSSDYTDSPNFYQLDNWKQI
jgi:uncharacterized membrane protein YjjP (DUF1212 family)